jgi:hypothetical protein
MAKNNARTTWTLIRHSAWSVKQDPAFEHAVETTPLTPKQAAQVLSAGGLLFDSYVAASDREEAENYPAEVQGIIPRARGSFVRRAGLGEVYIPATR